jgi:galactose mutarotase-like enzyme
MVPFKCDVHGWMNAYVGIVAHPYFAVTGKDGKFDLKTLPPGTYTIEAWHEKLGTQEMKVTIGAKETKDVSFTFKATGAAD